MDVAGNAMPYIKDKCLLFHGVPDGRILSTSPKSDKDDLILDLENAFSFGGFQGAKIELTMPFRGDQAPPRHMHGNG